MTGGRDSVCRVCLTLLIGPCPCSCTYLNLLNSGITKFLVDVENPPYKLVSTFNVQVWDMRTKAQVFALSGHENTVCSVITQATVRPQLALKSLNRFA